MAVKITVQIILAKVALAGVVEEEYDRVLTRDEAEQFQNCMDANLNWYGCWSFGFQLRVSGILQHQDVEIVLDSPIYCKV